jgi:3-deoxy-7-phosphoheptulonate synthase
MVTEWTPDSWRQRPILQQPEYPDAAALERTLDELRRLPPLVTSWEILDLQEQLAEAAAGRRFVLQGGDCAERFDGCTSGHITNALKVLLQMSLVLVVGAKRPVTRIGRFRGLRDSRRCAAALLPGRHCQPRRVHARSAPARSAAPVARL